MEQKFKVGDLVKCVTIGIQAYGETGEVVLFNNGIYTIDFGDWFEGHNCDGLYKKETYWNVKEQDLELAYPSDHDLLDFAARDSKIAELTAENEALKAELEKYKPKPESRDVELYLYRDLYGNLNWSYGSSDNRINVVARKTVTITEGEGM